MRRTRKDTRGSPQRVTHSLTKNYQHTICCFMQFICAKNHKNFAYALICYKQKCKVVSLNLAHPVYLIGVSKNYIFKTYFAQISNFIFSWKLLLLSFLDIFLFLNLYCLIIMVNYADLLTVICLYSHSLRGSTVLPTIP